MGGTMAGLIDLPGPFGILAALSVLAAGLGLLVLCGDALVAAAVKIAARFKIAPFVIGMTIVAFGTSAPELFVAIQAVLDGSYGVVFGNVVGSNICNILLVLGLPALLFTLSSDVRGLTMATVLMLGSTVLFIWFALSGGGINRLEAAGLLALLLAFLIATARQSGVADEAEDIAEADLPFGLKDTPLNTILVAAGAGFGLLVGANWTVTQAIALAQTVPGISQEVVGLTLIALGTSLPELAATIAAARRKEFGLGFGNIIGSNIFNIHAITGVAALVSPVGLPLFAENGADHLISGDLVILFAASALGAFYIMGREPRIQRLEGLLLFSLYLIYVGYLALPLM